MRIAHQHGTMVIDGWVSKDMLHKDQISSNNFGGQQSPVVLVAGLVPPSLALPHPHLLPHKVGLLLPLRLVCRS